MEGLEKILSRIKDDSQQKIDAMLAKANAEASEILREAKEKAENEVAEMDKRVKAELSNIEERAIASKELKSKQIKLIARREAIDETLLSIKEKISALPAGEYEALLTRAFDKYVTKEKASDKKVLLCFGEKDLKNLSKDIIDGFIKKAKERGFDMSLSEKPYPIKSGFVLDYGDILENCSFEAMIDQNKELLEDKINKVLF